MLNQFITIFSAMNNSAIHPNSVTNNSRLKAFEGVNALAKKPEIVIYNT